MATLYQKIKIPKKGTKKAPPYKGSYAESHGLEYRKFKKLHRDFAKKGWKLFRVVGSGKKCQCTLVQVSPPEAPNFEDREMYIYNGDLIAMHGATEIIEQDEETDICEQP